MSELQTFIDPESGSCKSREVDQPDDNTNKKADTPADEKQSSSGLLYGLNDVPPWYLCIAFGLQHYLVAIGSLIGIPMMLASKLCIPDDGEGDLGRANLISATFVVSGACTLIQTTIGNRLPIMQGISIAFLPPTLVILSLPHNQCPPALPDGYMNTNVTLYNDSGLIIDGQEVWHRRIREVQGAIVIGAFFEFLLGATGAVGFLMRFIGPLTIVPTVTLIGLDLFTTAARCAEVQWGVAFFTITVLTLCSQYLKKVEVPFPKFSFRRRKWYMEKSGIFRMFPVLIALLSAWLLCFILTVTDVFPNDPSKPYYKARTDLRANVIYNSPWFRFPYPGQWGLPIVTIGGVIGMLAAIISSTIESIGDYHACARLADVPPPPSHALNRGIMMEGIGVMLAGLLGTGSGTTSFSQNVAAIGITRVGSRRVLQTAGIMFMFLGYFSKFGSIFVTLPDPVIGGMFFAMFGMISAVGLSNLKYVDLDSNRNIFVIGVSLFMGLAIANWTKANSSAIKTGVTEIDQIFTIILSSAMLVGGVVGFFLDNTLPGTESERGLKAYNVKENEHGSSYQSKIDESYNLPFPTTCCRFARYFPFMPNYKSNTEKS
uniref:solute carrier family 23 member 2-like n=1 Tax=Ciona intestinalis TaxID=7719 RepID=UPI000180B174|nr:solute carrier family 23 member 2-like [Ciona intestinalis]|eukprot:XP_018672004.2 solute carrier family 23 member 2-like [Ciona intestinalis]